MLECRDRRLHKGTRDPGYTHCIPERCGGEDRRRDYGQGREIGHYRFCGSEKVCV